jgi:RNA polymerase sigma-70 factor (ECF subfamily)
MKVEVLQIDKVLIACKAGDSSAQYYVYEHYFHAMYNTAYRIVKDQFEAEDLMQEAFLSAFAKLDMFTGKSSFGSWLKRIVINKSISHLRSRKNQFIELDEMIEIYIEEAEDNDWINCKVEEIIELLYLLKDNYRIPLSLNLIEGYDYEEISQILGITNQNCRTLVSRAKSKLRSMSISKLN